MTQKEYAAKQRIQIDEEALVKAYKDLGPEGGREAVVIFAQRYQVSEHTIYKRLRENGIRKLRLKPKDTLLQMQRRYL